MSAGIGAAGRGGRTTGRGSAGGAEPTVGAAVASDVANSDRGGGAGRGNGAVSAPPVSMLAGGGAERGAGGGGGVAAGAEARTRSGGPELTERLETRPG